MKTIAFASLALCVLMGSAIAQLPSQPTVNSVKRDNGAVRDGFTLSNGQVMVTRDGVTQRVVQEFVLTDGAHLFPNGDIVSYKGGREHLQPNQLLTLDGMLEDTPVTKQGVAPVIPPGVSKNHDVGVSSRDGISVSGADTLLTRNGVTDKITKQLQLSHGVLVNPDGTFVKNGKTLTLRANEILGFDGVVKSARHHDTGAAAPAAGDAGKTR